MLKVFFTVDTEIWCNGWEDLDRKFAASFKRYVYGDTRRGQYGLPLQLQLLNDYGLTGVFFVEPLFSARFGAQPLAEMVGLITEAGQEAQLHMHTEWVDEARTALLEGINEKRQHLRFFSRAEQTRLLGIGKAMLEQAGSGPVNAFRAGNFALNEDTFHALAANGIDIDSSYNPACAVGVDNVAPGRVLTQPETLHGVREFPVTVFRDRGDRSLRHMQLTACSFTEMRRVLNQAADAGWDSVVIVCHNFELLNRRMDRPDGIAVRRLQRLFRFLANHADRFEVRGFRGLPQGGPESQPEPLRNPTWMTGMRMAAQAARRVYG